MGQMRADMASQMQVAAATGQPLLAPAPIQQFVYPPGLNPQAAYQQMHTVRMYDTPPQIQYIPNTPSNAPSPAQQPVQYGAAGQGPPQPPAQYQTAAHPPQAQPQFPIMCPIIPTQPHMMPAGMQYIQPPPPPQGHNLVSV